MKPILCIESGTNTCSVALGFGQELLGIRENHEPNNNHAKNLTVFSLELLNEQGLQASDLAAVAVSKGPGSYTGLRIGVSAAKGICFGAGIPLIAIGSLDSMAHGAIEWLGKQRPTLTLDIICPMIDARRMEVYTQFFDTHGQPLSEVEAKILDEKSFAETLTSKRMLFLGNGSQKAKAMLSSPNALFVDDFLPSAKFMLPLATERFNHQQFVDVAYFEPLYLKDFVATVAKNKVLGGN